MTEKEINEKVRIYSQRYILPFSLKDELDNLKFSATLTLITYKNRYFGITASHAIPQDYDLNKGVYIFDRNILGLTEVHRFDDIDLLILDFAIPYFIDEKKYYDLNEEYPLNEFIPYFFSWHGFPAKKAQDFHKKSVENLVLSSLNNGLITTNKSLLAGIPFKNQMDLSKEYIEGSFDLKNVEYDKEGKKTKGYSFQGMSGGALCLHKKELYPLEESFYFIGMGIEHKKDNTILGVNRTAIISKLAEVIRIPIELSFELKERVEE